MPRATESQPQNQVVKALIIGDGKCGKSHWAGKAAEDGFNLLYMDADVGSQTIAGLPTKAKENIYIMNCGDEAVGGGIEPRFAEIFKRFCTASPMFRWNDTQGRQYDLMKDGDTTQDEVWEIIPFLMDWRTVWVIDSWTSLTQSVMRWAADDAGIDLSELTGGDRGNMRGVYQAAGEKLTSFLEIIRAVKCHVIVIAHPAEFVKTQKPDNKTIAAAKEGELKVLWTKMVPKSSSNNHSMTMAKYFTDIAWLEANSMGEYKIDYRASQERISGSHIKKNLDSATDGSFANLVKAIGGTIPSQAAPVDSWLTIHADGYEVEHPKKKASLVLGATNQPGAAPKKVAGLNLMGSK